MMREKATLQSTRRRQRARPVQARRGAEQAPVLRRWRLTRWQRVSLELIGVFGTFAAIDRWILGATGFAGVDPHPFTFVVLVFALVYGAGPGLVAALIASGMWLVLTPQQFAGEADLFGYLLSIALLPLVWLIMAVVVGEVVSGRERIMQRIVRRSRRTMRHYGRLDREARQLHHSNSELQLRIATEQIGLPETLAQFADLASCPVPERRRAVAELLAPAAGLPNFRLYCRTEADGPWICAIDRLPSRYLHPSSKGSALMVQLARLRRPIHLGMVLQRKMLSPYGDIALPLCSGRLGDEVDGVVIFGAVPFVQMTRATIIRLQAMTGGLERLLALYPLVDKDSNEFRLVRGVAG